MKPQAFKVEARNLRVIEPLAGSGKSGRGIFVLKPADALEVRRNFDPGAFPLSNLRLTAIGQSQFLTFSHKNQHRRRSQEKTDIQPYTQDQDTE